VPLAATGRLGLPGVAEARKPQVELQRNGRASRGNLRGGRETPHLAGGLPPSGVQRRLDPILRHGYASELGRCRDSDDITLHQEMLALFTKYGIHQTRTGAEVYPILSAFRIVTGDPDEEEETGGCGREVINQDELDALGARYYQVSDKWAKELKVLAAKWLKTGTNPITAVTPASPVATPALRPRVKLVAATAMPSRSWGVVLSGAPKGRRPGKGHPPVPQES